MDFKVEIEEYEIISTGTIIGVLDKPIRFRIENLVFELTFRNNSEFQEQKLSTEVLSDGKKMILNFDNFNNSFGTGNQEPMKLGYVSGKAIYFNYRVYSLAENVGKQLHYTWLSKVKGG